MIKTALELALEKTAGLKADRAGAESSEAHKAGRTLAAAFMGEAEGTDLKASMAKQPKELRAAAMEGAVEIFLSYIQLPRDKVSQTPTDKIAAGLSALCDAASAKQIKGLLDQVKAFLSRYGQDIEQLEKAVIQQFGPKLRQKEQELARRTGQDVKIDPFKDPEFQAFFSKNLGQLKGQYQDALNKAREDLKALVIGKI
jgi:glutaredoxin 2